MEEYCQKLPKTELHAHLNGSLSTETLKKLDCDAQSVALYQTLTCGVKSSKTLEKCFELFKVAHNATKNKLSVYTATACVIEEFYKDNCIYLELRTTPRAEVDMTKKEYIESVVKAIRDNQADIIVKLILSIDRRHDVRTSLEVIELIIEMKEKFPDVIVGVDLCGNPAEGFFPKNVFDKAREHGLFVTLHCGEVKNDAEVEQILLFNPHRLGHATCLHPLFQGSEDIWKLFTSNPIPIECCMTSNVICETTPSYADHHLKILHESNLPFSISTDDMGVFCTNLSNEYYLAHKHFQFTQQQLWNISYAVINQSFASAAEKDELRHILEDWKMKNL